MYLFPFVVEIILSPTPSMQMKRKAWSFIKATLVLVNVEAEFVFVVLGILSID